MQKGEHHPTDYLAERIDKEAKIAKQLGTLGGGNHFLEIVYSEGDEQARGLRKPTATQHSFKGPLLSPEA